MADGPLLFRSIRPRF